MNISYFAVDKVMLANPHEMFIVILSFNHNVGQFLRLLHLTSIQ